MQESDQPCIYVILNQLLQGGVAPMHAHLLLGWAKCRVFAWESQQRTEDQFENWATDSSLCMHTCTHNPQ